MLTSIKRTNGDKVLDVVNVVLIIIITLVVAYPVVFVVFASLSDPFRVYQDPLIFWPKGFSLEGYARVFANDQIWRGFINSIIYTVVGTSINIVMTVLGAYPLSRRDFYGKGVVTLFIVFTMFFSGGMIPLYLVNRDLGILNSIWALVLPGAVGVFHLIIMRTFLQFTIPQELEDSAFMDGCNYFKSLLRIVLPLSIPVLAVMVLFYAVGHWNDYFSALIYLTDESKYPLQLILRNILIVGVGGEVNSNLTAGTADYASAIMSKQAIKYALVCVTLLPMFLFYPFVLKYLDKGVMIGSLKG